MDQSRTVLILGAGVGGVVAAYHVRKPLPSRDKVVIVNHNYLSKILALEVVLKVETRVFLNVTKRLAIYVETHLKARWLWPCTCNSDEWIGARFRSLCKAPIEEFI